MLLSACELCCDVKGLSPQATCFSIVKCNGPMSKSVVLASFFFRLHRSRVSASFPAAPRAQRSLAGPPPRIPASRHQLFRRGRAPVRQCRATHLVVLRAFGSLILLGANSSFQRASSWKLVRPPPFLCCSSQGKPKAVEAASRRACFFLTRASFGTSPVGTRWANARMLTWDTAGKLRT